MSFRASGFSGEVLSGEYLAKRLFSDLYDAASDLGVQLELDGAQINAIFDPDSSEDSQAGLIFGTTSTSAGLEAGAQIPASLDIVPGSPDQQ